MKNLSLDKAIKLAKLAHAKHAAYREKNPAGGIWESSDLGRLMFEPDSAEATAFKEQVRSLTKEESVDAVALMYVGRGDYVEDDSAKSVRAAFEMHRETFSHSAHDELTEKLLSKEAVMHRYLEDGIAKVDPAFREG